MRLRKTGWTWMVGDLEPRRVRVGLVEENRTWPTKQAALDARNYTDPEHGRYFNLVQALERENPEAFSYLNGPVLWEEQALWLLRVTYDVGLHYLGTQFIGVYTSVAKAKDAAAGIVENGCIWKRNGSGSYSVMAVGGYDVDLIPYLPDRTVWWKEMDFAQGYANERNRVIAGATAPLETLKHR